MNESVSFQCHYGLISLSQCCVQISFIVILNSVINAQINMSSGWFLYCLNISYKIWIIWLEDKTLITHGEKPHLDRNPGDHKGSHKTLALLFHVFPISSGILCHSLGGNTLLVFHFSKYFTHSQKSYLFSSI